jgi:hypothetical protein
MPLDFFEFLDRFKGRTVSSCWFSDYSILYLELGEAIDSTRNNPKHEHHIFLGYDWRLMLVNGQHIERLERDDLFVEKLLTGQIISDLRIIEENKLQVEFANGNRLESKSGVNEPPDWEIREFNQYACIDKGEYCVSG